MIVERSLRSSEQEKPSSLARKMLVFLGITKAYVRSISTREEDTVRTNVPLDYSDWKPVEAALVEAEHEKAKALEQTRRQHFL
jgi:hypothetical protein